MSTTRVAAVVLSAVLALSVAACDDTDEGDTGTDTETTTMTTVSETTGG